MRDTLREPVGMAPAVEAIRKVCAEAAQGPLLQPPCLLVPLDRGCGRTTLVRFAAEAFRAAAVCPFTAMEPFLEYTLDGSLRQLERVLQDVRSHAVYRSRYEGVAALDIAALAGHRYELQTERFLEEVRTLSAGAALLLFVPSRPAPAEEALLRRIAAALPFVRRTAPCRCTAREWGAVALRRLEERDVLPDGQALALLPELAERQGLNSPEACLRFAEALLQTVRCTAGRRQLEGEALLRAFPQKTAEKEEIRHEK